MINENIPNSWFQEPSHAANYRLAWMVAEIIAFNRGDLQSKIDKFEMDAEPTSKVGTNAACAYAALVAFIDFRDGKEPRISLEAPRLQALHS